MAGSERSGPLAATAALFDGRPWAVTPHAGSDPAAVAAVDALARLCGAEPVRLTPLEHDRAVARTSHLPHLLAVLAAGQLADAAPEHLSLSGQGVRDVTRIAAGDPGLWRQILRANQPAVTEVLREVEGSLRPPGRGHRERRRRRARRDPRPRCRRHPGHPRQARRARAARPRRCTSRCPTTRASSPGSSPTWARSGSTSRTCASTTTRAARWAWWSCWWPRTPPCGCVTRWGPGTGSPTGRIGACREPRRPVVGRWDGVSVVDERSRRWAARSWSRWTDRPGRASRARRARVASRLGLRYLDTGAQFRALTAADHRRRGRPRRPGRRRPRRRPRPVLESGTDPHDPTITVDGVDVAARIRTQEITDHVSAVASVPQVRRRLLELQRQIIGDGGIVVEGRDIGSVVAPDADVKLYLTADPAARAQRRTAENGAADVDATRADLERRDAVDSGRATAPAVAPDGAVHLDTTPFTLDEVVDQVVALVRQATGAGSAS